MNILIRSYGRVKTQHLYLKIINYRLFSYKHNFSNSKEYYSMLGVRQDANMKEIRKAFFELAKQHHPDLVDTSKN